MILRFPLAARRVKISPKLKAKSRIAKKVVFSGDFFNFARLQKKLKNDEKFCCEITGFVVKY